MKNEIQKNQFCDMTLAQATKIAFLHQDDPDWDFWTHFWAQQEEQSESDCENHDSVER